MHILDQIIFMIMKNFFYTLLIFFTLNTGTTIFCFFTIAQQSLYLFTYKVTIVNIHIFFILLLLHYYLPCICCANFLLKFMNLQL